MESLTIYPTDETTTDEVLSFCAEWKANKHYPHNTPEIIDFLSRRLEFIVFEMTGFQKSAEGLRNRLDEVETILEMIVKDDPCYNVNGCSCCHDSMAKEGLRICHGQDNNGLPNEPGFPVNHRKGQIPEGA